MNNRQKLINRLSNVSPRFKAELDYYMNDVDHEDSGREYDLADAFEDLDDLIITPNSKGSLWKELTKIYREIGYMIPIDLSQHTVLGGSKESLVVFRYQGVPYSCITSWESWIQQ